MVILFSHGLCTETLNGVASIHMDDGGEEFHQINSLKQGRVHIIMVFKQIYIKMRTVNLF